jgi:hypothetical protein
MRCAAHDLTPAHFRLLDSYDHESYLPLPAFFVKIIFFAKDFSEGSFSGQSGILGQELFRSSMNATNEASHASSLGHCKHCAFASRLMKDWLHTGEAQEFPSTCGLGEGRQ